MSTMEAVLQHTPYHAQLLAAIGELDHVPAALIQQDNYIKGLELLAKRGERKIKALEEKTKKEWREYVDLRDSTARRLVATCTGRKEKFEARANKEERDYIEALEKETEAKGQQAMLKGMIAEAKTVQADLKSKAELYRLTKEDLAELYGKIFDGPTQAYPEDDRLEFQLQLAQKRHNEIQGLLQRELQALSFLQSAHSTLVLCSSKIKEALSYSRWDLFSNGNTAKMMKRTSLSAAEGLGMQTATNIQQATLLSPQLQSIGELRIAHGSILSDVIFDNIFSELSFHDKIKESARSAADMKAKLETQLDAAKARTGSIDADLSTAAEAVAHARATLDAFRLSVFESLSGNIDSPPLYTTPVGPPQGQPAADETTLVVSSDATSLGPPSGPPPALAAAWGSRNPYAAALADGTGMRS
ncbi:hypothetical protein DFH09DRAFT_1148379 [Mycena vulgaris]|nr:hypothetical protein DFH09DRAFT_1148379 [Mycena vulgaris]